MTAGRRFRDPSPIHTSSMTSRTGVGMIAIGEREYSWKQLRLDSGDPAGWAHHDVAVLPDGELVAALPEGRGMVILGADGRQRIVQTELTEFHGIAVCTAEGQARLWVSDNGHKYLPHSPDYDQFRSAGRVVQLDLDGRIHQEIRQPLSAAYATANWKPCAVALADTEESVRGGAAAIWVADGYGESLVHCFDPDGTLRLSLDGSESGVAFSTPHALLIDRRRQVAELYVADRGNRRIVVYSMAGEYLRTIGETYLTSPSGLAINGSHLVITELFGAVIVLDINDVIVGQIGASNEPDRVGWPNSRQQGDLVAPAIRAGRFNSPHGVAARRDGRLYISEWIIGGRIVELTPA